MRLVGLLVDLTVKERIEEHEDRSTEITQSETQQKREKVK